LQKYTTAREPEPEPISPSVVPTESSDPAVASIALADPAAANGLESIADSTPSTNDNAEVHMVSDVKAVVSPSTSSKMYGGRSASGKAEKKAAVGGEFPEDQGGFIYGKDEVAKTAEKLKFRDDKTLEVYQQEGNSLKNDVAGRDAEISSKKLDQSKILYADRRFQDAKEASEQVLVEDPYNKDAQLMLMRANNKMQEEGRLRKESVVGERVAEADNRWLEPERVVAERVAEVEWKWSLPLKDGKIDSHAKKTAEESSLAKVLGKDVFADRSDEPPKPSTKEALDSRDKNLRGLPDFHRMGGAPAVINGKENNISGHLDSGIRSLKQVKAQEDQLALEAKVVRVSEQDLREVGCAWRMPQEPDPLLLKQNAAADQVLAASAKRGLLPQDAQIQDEAAAKPQAEVADIAKLLEDAEVVKDPAVKPANEKVEEVKPVPTPAEEQARRDKEREEAKQRALCFKDAAQEPLSTFAMDVDTASYQRVKEMIQNGQSVSPEAVRTEEFVNAFNYNYPTPTESTFAIHAEHAPSNLGQGRKILRVAVQAARPGADSRRPSRLTMLVDTSGSMARENRLPLLRKVLPEMLSQMRPSDTLTLIACDSSPRLLADRIPAGDTERLARAFAELKPSGATNLEAGLNAAYQNAGAHFDPAGMNRLVLISDGVANLGSTEAEVLLERASSARRLGISATVIGMGRGEYNDRFLETLADKGNGFYAYVDNADSAKRIFVDNFAANFASIAKDAKIQMEFDPKVVRSWRLLGYENRLLAAAEFRDDKVGGGEVGPGQAVTAVYELDCVPDIAPEARLGVMRIRYQDPSGRLARESERVILGRDGAASFDQASLSLRLAACAAQFAEQLKGYNSDRETTLKVLRQLSLEQPGNPALGELIQLMEKAGGEEVAL
jgi:Ca-activated chloride channel family protein